MRKRAVTIFAIVIAPWLTYVLLGNLFVATPLLSSLINRQPEKFLITYGRTYTLWPGLVHVRDLRLSFDTPRVGFEIIIDEATADIDVFALLKKRFRATHVRSRGVSYRMLVKHDPLEPLSPRIAAYPPVRGIIPFWTNKTPDPKPETAIEKLWTVQLNDVETTFRELWILEYRWKGQGAVKGGFAMRTLRDFWVGPCALMMLPGQVTVGDEAVSFDFAGTAITSVTPVIIPNENRLRMLRALQVDGQFTANLVSLHFLDRYGLEAEGKGRLVVNGQLVDGALAETARADLELHDAHGHSKKTGAGFAGDAKLRVTMENDKPTLRATGGGTVSFPLPGERLLAAFVPATEASLVMSTNDLTERWRTAWFTVDVPEAHAEDTRQLIAAMRSKLPFYAPPLLGHGPLLIRSASMQGTPKEQHIHVGDVKLGDAQSSGDLKLEGGAKPDGDFTVTVATLPVTVQLRQGRATVKLFSHRP